MCVACSLRIYDGYGSAVMPATTLAPVPDVDGRRWCRHCDKTLPVALFPSGRRRYICRKHVWERVTKLSTQLSMQDPQRSRLWLLWKRCWTDARTVFKQTRVGIVQGDIEALLRGVQGDGVSVMPADPTRVLCTKNAVLVQTPKRPQLVRAWRAGGAEGYALELAACVS